MSKSYFCLLKNPVKPPYIELGFNDFRDTPSFKNVRIPSPTPGLVIRDFPSYI